MTAKQLTQAEKLYDPNVIETNGKLRMTALVCKEEDGSYTVYPGEGRIRGYDREAVDKFIADHGYVTSPEPVKEADEPELS